MASHIHVIEMPSINGSVIMRISLPNVRFARPCRWGLEILPQVLPIIIMKALE